MHHTVGKTDPRTIRLSVWILNSHLIIYKIIYTWVNKYTTLTYTNMTRLTGFSIQSILLLNYAIPVVGADVSNAHCSTLVKS